MDRYIFLAILILFHAPVYAYLFLRHKKVFFEQKKFIFLSIIFATILYFTAIIIGASWEAWNYNYEKTLNIRIGSDILEILIQGVLTFVVLAVVVFVFAEREEKNQPLI